LDLFVVVLFCLQGFLSFVFVEKRKVISERKEKFDVNKNTLIVNAFYVSFMEIFI